MKRFYISCLFLGITFFNSFSQTLTREQKIQQALKDVNLFKLNKIDLKIFRHDRNNYWPRADKPKFRFLLPPAMPSKSFKYKQDTIDYYASWFMPSKFTTSDTLLLKDSTYVQYYREAAYKKTISRRTTGHYILLGGIIASGIAITIGTILILTNFKIDTGSSNYFSGLY